MEGFRGNDWTLCTLFVFPSCFIAWYPLEVVWRGQYLRRQLQSKGVPLLFRLGDKAGARKLVWLLRGLVALYYTSSMSDVYMWQKSVCQREDLKRDGTGLCLLVWCCSQGLLACRVQQLPWCKKMGRFALKVLKGSHFFLSFFIALKLALWLAHLWLYTAQTFLSLLQLFCLFLTRLGPFYNLVKY